MTNGSARDGVPAVVLGLNPNALGTVKSLTQAGIDCIAVERTSQGWPDTHRWMSSQTSLGRKLMLPHGATAAELLDALVELGRSFAAKAPIMPSGDGELQFLSENRAALAPFYELSLPSPETLELLLDKRRFQLYANSIGIATPGTFVVTESVIGDVARDIRYPCFLKPVNRDGSWDSVFAPAKGLTANNADELLRAFERARTVAIELIAQEIIPGPDSELYFAHSFIARDGSVAAMWTGHKIRQLPIHFGTATFAETLDVPHVAADTLKVARALDLRGYLSVEYKRDPRDGSYRLIEPTAGRTWYNHYLGTLAGCNIPAIWYRDALRLDYSDVPARAAYGVRWVDEYRDVIAASDYIAAGELTRAQWLRSFRGTRGGALFSMRDPKPGIYVGLRLMRSAWNAMRRRFG